MQLRRPSLRYIIFLLFALGLFWFSEEFSFGKYFEPESIGWKLSFSYAKDLIQPFAFYLLLCLGDKWLKTWQVRAAIAFAIPLFLELFQFLYYQIAPTRYVGSFDPLDIVMYAVGISLAVIVEQCVVPRYLRPISYKTEIS